MNHRESHYDWKIVDHDQEFKTEDYLSLNGSLNMIRFNPNYQMKVYKAEALNFYRNEARDYSLYELKNTSIVRGFSTRVMFDKVNRNWKMLMDTNKSIYDLNDEVAPFSDATLFEGEALNVELSKQFKMYIRFFFDNVKGKHGHFYICENDMEIREMVDQYYDLATNKAEKETWAKRIAQIKRDGRWGEFLFTIDKLITEPSVNNRFKMMPLKMDGAGHLGMFRAFMVFKGSLFKCNIEIENNESRTLLLSDESIFTTELFENDEELKKQCQTFDLTDELPPFDLL